MNASNGKSNNTKTSTALITVIAMPTATVSGGGTVCSGATKNISFALTGTAPWTITVNDGTSTNVVSGITTSPYVITQVQQEHTQSMRLQM